MKLDFFHNKTRRASLGSPKKRCARPFSRSVAIFCRAPRRTGVKPAQGFIVQTTNNFYYPTLKTVRNRRLPIAWDRHISLDNTIYTILLRSGYFFSPVSLLLCKSRTLKFSRFPSSSGIGPAQKSSKAGQTSEPSSSVLQDTSLAYAGRGPNIFCCSMFDTSQAGKAPPQAPA